MILTHTVKKHIYVVKYVCMFSQLYVPPSGCVVVKYNTCLVNCIYVTHPDSDTHYCFAPRIFQKVFTDTDMYVDMRALAVIIDTYTDKSTCTDRHICIHTSIHPCIHIYTLTHTYTQNTDLP